MIEYTAASHISSCYPRFPHISTFRLLDSIRLFLSLLPKSHPKLASGVNKAVSSTLSKLGVTEATSLSSQTSPPVVAKTVPPHLSLISLSAPFGVVRDCLTLQTISKAKAALSRDWVNGTATRLSPSFPQFFVFVLIIPECLILVIIDKPQVESGTFSSSYSFRVCGKTNLNHFRVLSISFRCFSTLLFINRKK